MNYPELIKYLFNLSKFGGVKLGLKNIEQLSDYFGNPHQKFRAIHVAGTNGKGTVTKKIAASLIAAGYKTGHYTSPHIACFRERIRINDVMISEEEIVSLFPDLLKAVDHTQVKPTFFEMTTLLAFLHFANQNVEYAVIETGLGGRLDATNIITPCLSIITSISLDHTEVLGSNIEQIAIEKAGIIKPKVPVILGPNTPHKILEAIANEKMAPCMSVNGSSNDFIEENTLIAQKALEHLNVPLNAIHKGLLASLECRFQELSINGKNVILDVAHNPDGIERLFQLIQRKFPNRKIRAICGLSQNKDILTILTFLMRHVIHFHLVEAPNGRGETTHHLRTLLTDLDVPNESVQEYTQIHCAVQHALTAMNSDEILVIFGTFFIMKEARAALGIQEPQDPDDLNEKPLLRSPHLTAAHQAWKELLFPADTVVDATCGNGHDAYILSQLIPQGHLYAMDIQQDAIAQTKLRLAKSNHIHVLHQCHSSFPNILSKGSVKLIVYNLGYLPKGNKNIITTPKTTLESLSNAIPLIAYGGAISIICYPSHPGGKAEEEAVFAFMENLPKDSWNVKKQLWPNSSPSWIWAQKNHRASENSERR